MNEPPKRHDITVRVATEAGHRLDPAAFAVTSSRAAAARNASTSPHTAGEIICIVSVYAATGPGAGAAAIALAVVADALRVGDSVPSLSVV